jgi:hypothetical protein
MASPLLPRRGMILSAVACVLMTVITLSGLAAKPSVPVIFIPLEPLGFMGVQPRLLTGGATMLTVSFVDSTHVLFTYNARTLVSRRGEKAADDLDRNVAAVLLELPSGRVLARTEWHTRDRAQYLWPLSHGRFLLRIGTELTLLDPLHHGQEDDAFKQHAFLETHRRIGYISVSPGGDLLAVETIPAAKAAPQPVVAAPAIAQAGPATQSTPDATPATGAAPGLKRRPPPAPPVAAPAAADPTRGPLGSQGTGPAVSAEDDEVDRQNPVQIHFYRLLEVANGKKTALEAQSAGIVYAPNLISVPVTAEGYLDVAREKTGAYDFDFRSHTGKHVELAAFDSSCTPHPFWISRSDFISFGCTTSADHKSMSYFTLRGEEPWISTFSEQFITPTLALAPEAGRFALGRTLINGALVDMDNLAPESFTAEDISVRRDFDGQALLRVQATPIQRTGQNFDLSADGLELAVIHDGNLEIYQLPELSSKERTALKLAQADAPERNEAMILLGATPVEHRRQARAEGVPKGSEVLPDTGAAAGSSDSLAATAVEDPGTKSVTTPESAADAKGSAAGQAAADANTSNVVGDVPVEHRKPPSLYDADHPKPANPQ